MATNLSNVTFQNVYKDDFRDSDNYHRILFNSGKALQARELTQRQRYHRYSVQDNTSSTVEKEDQLTNNSDNNNPSLHTSVYSDMKSKNENKNISHSVPDHS